jgi:hypothetical protein
LTRRISASKMIAQLIQRQLVLWETMHNHETNELPVQEDR